MMLMLRHCTHPPPPFKVPKLRSSRQLGEDEDPNRVVIDVVLFITMLNTFSNGIGGCCDVAITPPPPPINVQSYKVLSVLALVKALTK
jgi:hypothetical protein